jgi:NhaA family Na+:H+ antiporter
MNQIERPLSFTFQQFFKSEKTAGILLLVCTVASLSIANSGFGLSYVGIWRVDIGGLNVEHWINDGLMAVFFLLIGLELEREIYSGELSDFRNALLPAVAAFGGIAVPAAIHYSLNASSPTQPGIGIPMATDIAFALGVLSLLGKNVPASLKVFLTALAVIDDLGAILVIALFYTADLSVSYLFAALAVLGSLVVMNRMRVMQLFPYLLGGLLMWYFMLRSGVHATIAGVMLAFVIPYSAIQDDSRSPSQRLEHILHKPVAFLILPLFALANTAIVIGSGWLNELMTANSLGIMAGLLVGKPLGITLFTAAAVLLGICRLPLDLRWRHVLGAGLLAGIGFTMSIFIANLAFPGFDALIDASKMAILSASLAAGVLGLTWLKLFGKPEKDDLDTNTMNIERPSRR